MDRELEAREVWGRRRGRVAWAGLAVVVAGAAIAFVPSLLRPSVSRDRIRTSRVERGPIEAVLQAAGSVIPAFESVLSSPVEARVVRLSKRPGDRVAVGEEILELDTSASRLDFERREDRFAQKLNEQEQVRLELEKQLIDLRGRIERQKLDAEVLEARVAQNLKLEKDGLVSAEALRVSEVEAKKARIEVRQLEEEVGSSQRATQVRLAGLALDLKILDKEREEARRQLALASTRADRAGVVTWVFPEVGGTVRAGDIVARIADPESFRVEATASDIHSTRLAAGLSAEVRVGDAKLPARVATVFPSVENGSVKFAVDLAEPKNPKLRDKLRVDVLVVTDTRAEGLRVASGPFAEGSALQDVFVIRGAVAERRRVRFGLVGSEWLEILDGLEVGDEVIVSDLKDYLHLSKIRLKN